MGFWRWTNDTLCDWASTGTAMFCPVFVQCDRFPNLLIISQKNAVDIYRYTTSCIGVYMMHCVRHATRYVYQLIATKVEVFQL